MSRTIFGKTASYQTNSFNSSDSLSWRGSSLQVVFASYYYSHNKVQFSLSTCVSFRNSWDCMESTCPLEAPTSCSMQQMYPNNNCSFAGVHAIKLCYAMSPMFGLFSVCLHSAQSPYWICCFENIAFRSVEYTILCATIIRTGITLRNRSHTSEYDFNEAAGT